VIFNLKVKMAKAQSHHRKAPSAGKSSEEKEKRARNN
jgi:hypothetical protein